MVRGRHGRLRLASGLAIGCGRPSNLEPKFRQSYPGVQWEDTTDFFVFAFPLGRGGTFRKLISNRLYAHVQFWVSDFARSVASLGGGGVKACRLFQMRLPLSGIFGRIDRTVVAGLSIGRSGFRWIFGNCGSVSVIPQGRGASCREV